VLRDALVARSLSDWPCRSPCRRHRWLSSPPGRSGHATRAPGPGRRGRCWPRCLRSARGRSSRPRCPRHPWRACGRRRRCCRSRRCGSCSACSTMRARRGASRPGCCGPWRASPSSRSSRSRRARPRARRRRFVVAARRPERVRQVSARARLLQHLHDARGVLAVALAATLPTLAVAGRRRAATTVAWLTSAVALALTLVRGAWLGFGAGVLSRAHRRAPWSIAVAVVAAAVLLLLAVPRVRQRAETIADPADPTARERLAMLDAGLTMLRSHPLIGVGLGGVKRLYPAYAPPEAVRRHTSHLHTPRCRSPSSAASSVSRSGSGSSPPSSRARGACSAACPKTPSPSARSSSARWPR